MTTETTRDTGLAPWQDWEIGEGDVVWRRHRHGPGCDNSRMVGRTLGVFLSREDASFAPFNGEYTLGAVWPCTIDQAKRDARDMGRSAVVLRDREGKEIDRWEI